MTLSEFTLQYWYSLVIIGALFGYFANYLVSNVAKGAATKVALEYLLAAEKVVFQDPAAKLAVISSTAYAALPSRIKVFLPLPIFTAIVTTVYEQVKTIVEELHNNPNVPANKPIEDVQTPEQAK